MVAAVMDTATQYMVAMVVDITVAATVAATVAMDIIITTTEATTGAKRTRCRMIKLPFSLNICSDELETNTIHFYSSRTINSAFSIQPKLNDPFK